MKFPAEYRNARALLSAVCLGLATAAVFSIVLAVAPFLGPSNDTDSAKPSVHVSAQASPVSILRQATAAVPSVASQAKPAVDIVGGDSRADDYRLERDSCCIGN